MAAPKGNQNAAKAKQWTAAIERALEKRAKTGQTRAEVLDEMAEKFLKSCDEGDLASFKELGDRLEGKAAQSVEMSGPSGEPIQFEQRPQITKEEWLKLHGMGTATRATE